MSMGVYCIKNIKNNKLYIGSSRNIEGRFRVHKSRLKLNKHHSDHLQKSYNIDFSCFVYEIVELIKDETQLEIREQHWVDHYQSYKSEFGYNAVKTVSKIDPERMRERWAKPGEKEKQKLRMTPINRTSERRKKVSEGLKKHLSDPINRYQKLLLCPHRKKILCIETNQVFNSIAEASRMLGISVVKIRDSFTGKRQSRGLSFKEVSDE